jgi:hypothetical protein
MITTSEEREMTINDLAGEIVIALAMCLMKIFGWRKDDNVDDRKFIMKRRMTIMTSFGSLKRNDWSRGLSWKKVGAINSYFGSEWETVLSSVEVVVVAAAAAAAETLMIVMRRKRVTVMTVYHFGKSERSF